MNLVYLNLFSKNVEILMKPLQVLKCTTHLPLLAFYNIEMRRAIIKKLPNLRAIAKKIKKYM